MRPYLKIQDQRVGADYPTYFIADVAANHDGDLEKAKDLIYASAEAGADAAKFQNFEARTIVSDYGFKALGHQQSHQAKWKKSVYEVYDDAALPLDWTEELKETCDKAGIHYFTSPYSSELTQAVAPYVAAWKMGSGDITWHDQITEMCKDGKPFIMATGAASIEEVEAAVQMALQNCKTFVLMQCNTNYTASMDENLEQSYERFSCINLRVLETYAQKFPECILGLSDHTHGHDTVLGAVGLYDARAIEKHFTLDNSSVGPDHPFSMNPKTWREMVEQTRNLESRIKLNMDFDARYQIVQDLVSDPKALEYSLGDGVKRIEENEQETVVLQRRAVRANTDLSSGHILGLNDFFPLRPAPQDCIPPYKIKDFIGKTLVRDVPAGDYLRIEDFDG